MKEVNDEQLFALIAEGKKVVCDFWADWCGPCKMQAPILDALAEEMDGKIKVGKVNVDEEAALALKYQVMSIPTMVLMDQGVFVKRVSGVQQLEDLRAFVGK